MTENPIKVLIVDDSKVSRDLLAYIVGLDPSLKVIGFAENGLEGIEFIKKQKPDVIMTDIEMPKMNGFQFTRKIMETNPIPIIVVSGVYNQAEVATGFDAIDAGALAIIEKPKGLGDTHCMDTARFVAETIKTMAKVKLEVEGIAEGGVPQKAASFQTPQQAESLFSKEWKPTNIEVVAIGASIGGPKAIRTLLSQLPRNFPVPILIVQHITSGFIDGFINWLNASTTFNVKMAVEGEELKAGTVYICPDMKLMKIGRNRNIALLPSDFTKQSESSISTLFASIQETFGQHAIAILLTGAGKDGSKELLNMRNNGVYTIAQDKGTSVKFDLPQSAIDLGAVHTVAPLQRIPGIIEKLMKERATLHA